jgi:hypothetical protein
MTAAQNLYLAFSLTAVRNESVVGRQANFVWSIQLLHANSYKHCNMVKRLWLCLQN